VKKLVSWYRYGNKKVGVSVRHTDINSDHRAEYTTDPYGKPSEVLVTEYLTYRMTWEQYEQFRGRTR
jgi:hypothetical protein